MDKPELRWVGSDDSAARAMRACWSLARSARRDGHDVIVSIYHRNGKLRSRHKLTGAPMTPALAARLASERAWDRALSSIDFTKFVIPYVPGRA